MGDIYEVYQRAWTRVRRDAPVQYDHTLNGEGAYFQHDDAQGIPPIIIGTFGGFERKYPSKPGRVLLNGKSASDERPLTELTSTLDDDLMRLMSPG